MTGGHGRRLVGAVVAAAALLGTAACGGSKAPAPDGGTAPADAAFPRTVTHAMGETVIPERPQRVVALDNTLTGAVLLLGHRAGRLHHAAGRRRAAAGVPRRLRPAVRGRRRAGRDAQRPEPRGDRRPRPGRHPLRERAPREPLRPAQPHRPTVFSETTGPTWKDNLLLAGRALGAERQAEEAIGAFEARARRVGDAIRTVTGGNPTISVVRFVDGPARLYTERTYSGVVLADAGLARPPSQQGGGEQSSSGQVELSEERILDADADHIFVTTYPDPAGASAAVQQRFARNPLWGRLRGRIHEASDLTWMSAVGMQGAHAILDDLAVTFGVDPVRP
jgi:iron complex transport system substrate-binding protein